MALQSAEHCSCLLSSCFRFSIFSWLWVSKTMHGISDKATHSHIPACMEHDYLSSYYKYSIIFYMSFMCVYTKYLCMCVLFNKKNSLFFLLQWSFSGFIKTAEFILHFFILELFFKKSWSQDCFLRIPTSKLLAVWCCCFQHHLLPSVHYGISSYPLHNSSPNPRFPMWCRIICSTDINKMYHKSFV